MMGSNLLLAPSYTHGFPTLTRVQTKHVIKCCAQTTHISANSERPIYNEAIRIRKTCMNLSLSSLEFGHYKLIFNFN